MPTELHCAKCGYDLRSQPADGVCPECATPVDESARIAALPLRPSWAESDPRWRRRVLAGLWVLLLVPLPVILLQAMPPYDRSAPYGFWDAFRDYYIESYVSMVYSTLAFCVGTVLLFARERGCRPRWLDTLRRWATLGPYLVLLAGLGAVAGVTLLVLTGIDAQINPPGDAAFRQFARGAGQKWSEWSFRAMQPLAAAVVVLAGVVLLDALHRAGAILLGRAMVIVGVLTITPGLVVWACYVAGLPWANEVVFWEPFFQPHTLGDALIGWLYWAGRAYNYVHPYDGFITTASPLREPSNLTAWAIHVTAGPLELAKWTLVLLVAARLTGAQVRAWRRPTLA